MVSCLRFLVMGRLLVCSVSSSRSVSVVFAEAWVGFPVWSTHLVLMALSVECLPFGWVLAAEAIMVDGSASLGAYALLWDGGLTPSVPLGNVLDVVDLVRRSLLSSDCGPGSAVVSHCGHSGNCGCFLEVGSTSDVDVPTVSVCECYLEVWSRAAGYSSGGVAVPVSVECLLLDVAAIRGIPMISCDTVFVPGCWSAVDARCNADCTLCSLALPPSAYGYVDEAALVLYGECSYVSVGNVLSWGVLPATVGGGYVFDGVWSWLTAVAVDVHSVSGCPEFMVSLVGAKPTLPGETWLAEMTVVERVVLRCGG